MEVKGGPDDSTSDELVVREDLVDSRTRLVLKFSHLDGCLREIARVIATIATSSQSFVNVKIVMMNDNVQTVSDPNPCGYL